MLEVKTFNIEGPVLLIPRVFVDERGYFMESYQKDRFMQNGVAVDFIQDNESK